MSELPDRWAAATVGDINRFSGRTVDPKATPEIEYELYSVPTFPTGRPELLRGGEIGSTKQAVEPNDVLVCKINPRINRVWVVGSRRDRPQIASSEWIGVRAPDFDAQFLRHYFSSPTFRELIEEGVSGVGGSLTRAQPKRVATFPVPVAPASEQKRIADKLHAVLTRVDACRARLDRVPAILKRFREAVLEAAVSGRLTEEWRAEDGAPTPEKDVPLASVWIDASYGSAAKSQKSGKVPVLRMGNIQNGRLDWNDLVFTSDAAEIRKYALAAGDLLFNRTNSPELVGKTAVYHGERPAIYAGYLIRVRCGSRLHPDYLGHCLSSPAGRDYCWRVKTDGVSQSNINSRKLGAFTFLLPSHGEQCEIVRRVGELFALADGLEAKYRAAVERLERLTPAVLTKAFRGELVPQDPNDEPAEVLLARIREQQNAATGEQPRRVMRAKRSVSTRLPKKRVQR